MEMRALLYYRSKLDAHDQAVYDSLVNQWMHFYKCVRIPVPHCDFSRIIDAIIDDYPLLFYINYYKTSYSVSPFGMTIQGDYIYSKDEAEILLEKCRQWGKYIHSHMPSGICTTEKALWLHDVILSNVRYGNENGISAHNLIGVVSDGVAVCEGISKAYKYLCDYADIPCTCIRGTLNGNPHSWNMVWINNEASFVDVTNDIHPEPGEFGRSNFLRKSTEMAGYTWETSLIPECRLTNKSNAYATAHSRHELVKTVLQMDSRESIGIYLDFGHPLTQAEVQMLITICQFRCPSLFTKSMSFSPERQILYIANR